MLIIKNQVYVKQQVLNLMYKVASSNYHVFEFVFKFIYETIDYFVKLTILTCWGWDFYPVLIASKLWLQVSNKFLTVKTDIDMSIPILRKVWLG